MGSWCYRVWWKSNNYDWLLVNNVCVGHKVNFDCADRYIPKLFAAGIKQGNIVILDGILQVSQPYFLLLTTVYLVFSYINAYVPIYTNILYQIMPMSVWQIIGIGQYLFPLIVLLKIKVPPKIWFYYCYIQFLYIHGFQ